MKIGVISDTHIPTKKSKLPDSLLNSLEDVDIIIHAGDLVDGSVLGELNKIAPVHAVHGNVDFPRVKKELPARLELELAGFKVAVTHGHLWKGSLPFKLPYVFPEADIIIFGHTHKPLNKKAGDQILFNPGSPTDRRLQPHYSFGIIEIDNELKTNIIEFD